MKRRSIAVLLAFLGVLAVLSGCVRTEESGFDYTFKALSEAEKVTVHIYNKEEEEAYRVPVTEELIKLVKGEWTPVSGQDGGKKTITLTVDTQHEITFFDNGRAMIFYGYASVVERDRCYYEAKLDGDVAKIEEYTNKHGIHADAAAILELFAREGDHEKGKKPLEIKATLSDKSDVVYSLESSADIDSLFAGSWKKAEGGRKGEELLSMTVDGKYKLCILEGEIGYIASISEINSQGEEKNTAHYTVSLDGGVTALSDYIAENGKVLK